MTMDRRMFLRATVAGGTVLLSASAGSGFAQARKQRRRVCVVVLDGLRPDEVSPDLTPNLTALKAEGTWFGNARSLPIMETIPNHVMMMSGVRPDRSGVPANSVYDRDERAVRDLDRPSDLRGEPCWTGSASRVCAPEPCCRRSTCTASSVSARPTAGSRARSCRTRLSR